MKISDFRANPKTAYWTDVFDDLAKKIAETQELIAGDESVRSLAEEEIKSLEKQQTEIWEKMEEILNQYYLRKI